MAWSNDEVRKAMLAKLKESGITPTQATKLGMVPFTAVEAQAKLKGLPEYRAGFKIPYYKFDNNKRPSTHYRFRYLEPDEGFLAQTVKKPLKYAQPSNSDVEVYTYPGANWAEIFPADTPLFITEGELKAICACQHKIPCLGLGGVNMAVVKGALLPTLAQINWKRHVYVIFDSDAKDNIQVRRAEAMLCDWITQLGAMPHVVRLPSIMGKDKDGKELKTGLDDLLVVAGPSRFDELIDDELSPTGSEAKALNDMAAEVLYLSEPDLVYAPAENLRMNTAKFITSHYAHRHYVVVKEAADGKMSLITKDTAKEFIRWPARTELRGFTFVPGADPIINRQYNLWPGWPREPKAGPVVPWERLLDHIFENKPAAERKWFEQWVAYPIQHPGAKLKQAVLLWGGQGTGKSFLGETILRLYGWDREKPSPECTGTIFNNSDLISPFTGWAESKQFALGEEIVVDTRERGAISESLKQLVTGLTINIHRKYLNPYTLPNCMNMIIVSNHAVPIRLEHDDRRFFIIQNTNGKLPPDIYRPLDAFVRSDKGMAALFHHYLHVDLKGFDPEAPALQTQDRMEMIEGSSAPHDAWLRTVQQRPKEMLVFGKLPMLRQYWTAQELLDLYKQTPEGESTRISSAVLSSSMRALKFCRPHHTAIKTATGTKKLWFIPLNGSGPATTSAEIAKAYDTERLDPVAKYTEAHKEKK